MLLAYKILVAALAFMGSVSLMVSGELNILFVLPGLAMIPGYYRYIRGYEPANRWIIAGLAMVELGVVAFDSLMVSGDFFIAVAHMTIVFQALKSFDHREAWDPLQVYFMSMLQVVMASELTLSMAMGAVFVVFLFVFMAALVFSHFLKEGTIERVRFKGPLINISLIALLATVIFFVAVPRVRSEIWGRKTSTAIHTVGFSDTVDFGSFGRILEDPSIVMRAELSGEKLPYYWRGVALDHFDGHSWSDTIRHRARVYRSGGQYVIDLEHEGELTSQKIIIEPLDTDVVFALGKIVAIEGEAWRTFKSRSGGVTMPQKKSRRFTYTVHSAPWDDEPVHYRQYYRQMPEGMEQVGELARQVAGQGTALQQARRINTYLQENYQYSLRTEAPPEGNTPIQYFLFDSKKGFCEHYATAMVLMLRSLDIPARIVTGFLGGEENAYGNYVIVRQSNAHSWVEAAINDEWVRFDPTPVDLSPRERGFLSMALDSMRMSWYRYVVGFSSRDQVRMLKAFSSPIIELPRFRKVAVKVPPGLLILLGLTAIAGVAWFVVWIMRERKLSLESRLYRNLKRRLRRKGARVGPGSTPADVLSEARRLSVDARKLEEFVRLYEYARFGEKKLSLREREALRVLVR